MPRLFDKTGGRFWSGTPSYQILSLFIFNMTKQSNLDLDLIVLNCTLATVEDVVQCDIGVKDEKIHSILPQGSLAGSKAKKTIDAKGALVTVGLFPPLSRVN